MVVLAFAYAYGHRSGAQLNPAVSFALFVAGVMNARQLAVDGAAQILGGVLGAIAPYWVLGGAETGLGAGVAALVCRGIFSTENATA